MAFEKIWFESPLKGDKITVSFDWEFHQGIKFTFVQCLVFSQLPNVRQLKIGQNVSDKLQIHGFYGLDIEIPQDLTLERSSRDSNLKQITLNLPY